MSTTGPKFNERDWSTSIDRDNETIRRTSRCAVCGNERLETAIDLPDLPLTGLYSPNPPTESACGYDQHLLVCAVCGHAQAGFRIATSILYGGDYGFRTSVSAMARAGTEFFLKGLAGFVGTRRFRCVVDVGCNDLYLLDCLENAAEARIGIDPIWKGREHEVERPGIRVIGEAVEGIDFQAAFKVRPDLIVCRHALEHIAEPVALLGRLMDVAARGAVFAFEVPGFDALVARRRFDQVFHQHLQYFSIASFRRLIKEVGAHYLGFRENYHDWGALLVVFRKERRPHEDEKPAPPMFTIDEIRSRYELFRGQLYDVNRIVRSFDRGMPVYGYGAAQMLPILAYHLGNDLSCLKAILDDDPGRDGWYYQNLPTRIVDVQKVSDVKEAAVFVTAADNVKPIVTKLLIERPKHIVLPFNLF